MMKPSRIPRALGVQSRKVKTEMGTSSSTTTPVVTKPEYPSSKRRIEYI